MLSLLRTAPFTIQESVLKISLVKVSNNWGALQNFVLFLWRWGELNWVPLKNFLFSRSTPPSLSDADILVGSPQKRSDTARLFARSLRGVCALAVHDEFFSLKNTDAKKLARQKKARSKNFVLFLWRWGELNSRPSMQTRNIYRFSDAR